MTNLNKYLIDEIYTMLDCSELGVSNFDVKFPSEGKVLVDIVFKPCPDYQIIVKDLGGLPHKVCTEEKPGNFLKMEVHGGLGFQEVPGRVSSWTENVNAEIRAIGKREQGLEDLSSQIEEMVKEHVENPHSKFTSDELNEIRERLQDLEKRFEDLEKGNKISLNELTKLKGHVIQASEDAPAMQKGIWYKLSLNRIFGALKEIAKSKEGREVLKEAVKKLIGL